MEMGILYDAGRNGIATISLRAISKMIQSLIFLMLMLSDPGSLASNTYF